MNVLLLLISDFLLHLSTDHTIRSEPMKVIYWFATRQREEQGLLRLHLSSPASVSRVRRSAGLLITTYSTQRPTLQQPTLGVMSLPCLVTHTRSLHHTAPPTAGVFRVLCPRWAPRTRLQLRSGVGRLPSGGCRRHRRSLRIAASTTTTHITHKLL